MRPTSNSAFPCRAPCAARSLAAPANPVAATPARFAAIRRANAASAKRRPRRSRPAAPPRSNTLVRPSNVYCGPAVEPCRAAFGHAQTPKKEPAMKHTMIALAMCLGIGSAAHAGDKLVNLVKTPDRGIQPQAVTDAKGTVHLLYFSGTPAAGNLM